MFLNPSLKMTISFANIARTTAAQVNLYIKKDFKSSGIASSSGSCGNQVPRL